MRRPALFASLLALGGAFATSCTDFDRVDRNICGNAIVEPDRREDCDGAPMHEDGVSYACGAQSTSNACRLLCNTEGRACPDGWACSLHDGVCRQARFAEYELAERRSVPELTRVTTADLDRDGLADLIVGADDRGEGTTHVTTYHFSPEGTIDGEPRREGLSLLRNSPLVAGPLGPPDGTGTSGVAILIASERAAGVAALRGQSDRSLASAMVGQFTGIGHEVVFPPDVEQGDGEGFGYVGAFGDATAVLINSGIVNPRGDEGLDTSLMSRVSPDLSTLPTPLMAKGKINTLDPFGPIAGVESLVVAVPGETHARLYWVDPTGKKWPYERIALPAGVSVPSDGGVWLGDVNGDDFLDLLVSGDDGNTYMAYGFGLNGFTSSLDLPIADMATGAEPVIRGAHPLGVANIDDDELVDFVFPEKFAIALSNPQTAIEYGSIIDCPELSSQIVGSYTCSVHSGDDGSLLDEPPHWHRVLFEDINGDGRDDVIAASASGNELDVFMVSPHNDLRRRRIETPGRVRSLRGIDYDADLIRDVIFHVDGDGSDQIFVALGSTEHGIEAPELLFEAPTVLGVSGSSAGGSVAAWRTHDEQPVQLSTYGQSDGRSLSASLIPCPTSPGQRDIRQQLVMGRFDDREGPDVALLYHDCFRPHGAAPLDLLVLYPAGPLGTLDAVLDTPFIRSACPDSFDLSLFDCPQLFNAWHPTSVELATTSAWSTDALLVAIDLDPGDNVARDELIAIAPTGATTSELLVFGLDPDPPGLPRFELLRRAAVPVRIGGSYEGGWRGKLETTDVDGDGDLDVVALTSGDVTSLVVFDNQDGELSTEPRLVTFATTPKGSLRSFAVADADYDLARDDLVLAADDDIYVVVDAFSGTATPQLISVAGLVDIGDEAVDDLLATDFNGDGLVDIAAVYPTSVRILRSLPANP